MIVVTHTIHHLSGWLGERWGGLLIGLPISTALTWGGRVKLAAIPPLIYESLETARLHLLFEVCATVEEAQAV
jgi:hypothetical protein